MLICNKRSSLLLKCLNYGENNFITLVLAAIESINGEKLFFPFQATIKKPFEEQKFN